jgi:hypothetical protein
MFKFVEYLIEAAKKREHALNFSSGAGGDAAGKLYELLVGKHLRGDNKHMEHHRVGDKTPEEIHNMLANKLFGEEGQNHAGYQLLNNHAKDMAEKLREYFKLKGQKPRVVWTSQPGDHEKETNIPDPASKADLIINKQHAISAKFGATDKPNYFNPGLENFEEMAGKSLQHHQEKHSEIVKSFGLSSGTKGHAKYKELRDSDNFEDNKKAEAVEKSANERNKNIAADVRKGLSKRSDAELRKVISRTVNAPTVLPTTVAHTILNSDGTATHHVHPIDEHVNSYLNQFTNLHVDPNDKSGSVTIHGHYNNPGHKDHGKRMSVWSTPVYSGGRPTGSARGAVKLNSESNKSISSSMQSNPAPPKMAAAPKPTKPKRAAKPKVAAAPKPTKPKRVKPFKEVIAPAPVVRPQRKQRVRTPISSAPVAAAPSTQSLLNRPRPKVARPVHVPMGNSGETHGVNFKSPGE